MKKLVLIDGKSVYYRGYYAMGNLRRRDGRPTGGVYGFAVIALELVRRLRPDKVVVAWDSKTSTAKRRAIYPEYKAGRHKPPEDFFAQIPDLRRLVGALGWEMVEVEEYEADDIIGTLAYQAKSSSGAASASADARFARRTSSAPRSSAPASLNQPTEEDLSTQPWETVIISSDLDMLQVVDEHVRMYRLLKGFSDLDEMDVRAVEEKYGIRKEQFLDLKALKGDNSDNIPGVPGIGEKGAVKLLNEYGDLDGIYAHLGEIKGATGRKLAEGRESAYMSYELGKIMTDAPVRLSEVRDYVWDWGKVREEFEDLEFYSLIKKYKGESSSGASSASEDALLARRTLSAPRSVAPSSLNKPPEGDSSTRLGDSQMKGGKSNEKKKVNEKSDFHGKLPEGMILAWDVKKLMHGNAEVAERILAGAEFWDLGQGSFLLWGRTGESAAGTGAEGSGLAEILRKKQMKLDLPEEEKEEVEAERVEYVVTEVEVREYLKQKAEMERRPRVREIFLKYDLPMVPVLYKMEKAGIGVDLRYFKRLEEEFTREVREKEAEIWRLAGVEFNVNSPMQLSEVLFEELKLPTAGIKKTTRGYSTGAKELEKMRVLHPVVGEIMEYREVAKLLSTYVLPVPRLADRRGRIHTTFTQNVTATGRLSSVNPNLQNIPVRTEEGRRIRRGYVAGKGRKFVSADYSQFELRLAAALAGDEALIRDFNAGVDIHTKTAADVFKIAMDEVTPEQRRAAKTINFGVLYGMSARGLAEAAGMSVNEAQKFINGYFTVRRPIREYLDEVLRRAREEGYVETFYGRRREVPEVRAGNFAVRAAGERAAMNMPIQGTEADLMKRAMVGVDRALEGGDGGGGARRHDSARSLRALGGGALDGDGARLVLQVHDSIMVECGEGEVERVSEILIRVMEGVAPELPVKLKVEVKVSDWWV